MAYLHSQLKQWRVAQPLLSTKDQTYLANKLKWFVVGLTITAYALYLFQLDGQSLWRDEGLTVVRANQSLAATLANQNLVQGVASPDLHPPLYFLFIHAWRIVAGESEFALRYPSVLSVTLAIALFSAVGRQLWNQETGFWAAFLALLSPFYRWYAQEARMYALVLLESLILLYFLWPLLTRQRTGWRAHVPFGLAAVILLYTHYTGFFLVLFALGAYLVVRLRRRVWPYLLLIPAVIALAMLPLYANLYELATAAGFIAFDRQPPWTLLQWGVSTFSLSAAMPVLALDWRLLPFAILAIIGAFTLDVIPEPRRRLTAFVALGGLLGIVTLFYLASWVQPNFSNPRHLIVLSPFWFLLMGHGLFTLRHRLPLLAGIVGLVTFAIGGAVQFQEATNPLLLKDDVRGLAAYMQERAAPGDAVLWHNAVMMTTYDYYALDLPYTASPRYAQYDEAAVLEEVAQWVQPHQRIWFIRYPPPNFFEESLIPTWFAERMVRLDSREFPASWATLGVELYQPFQFVDAVPADAFSSDLQQGAYRVQGVLSEAKPITGRGVWLSIYWSLEGSPAAEPAVVCARLRDSQALTWSEGCTTLAIPAGQDVAAGALIEQQLWLPLPWGLAPVAYDLELILAEQSQVVGRLDLQRPQNPPAFTPQAEFDQGPSLVRMEWASDQFYAGVWAVANFVWQAPAAPQRDRHVTVRLVNWRGQTVAEQAAVLGPADYPAGVWQPGELVRTLVGVKLPFDLDGWYRVQVSLAETNGEALPAAGLFAGRWANAGWLHVAEWPIERELPAHVTQRPAGVEFGPSIQLAGYEMGREGDSLSVELYWRTEELLSGAYGVFVHVGRPGEAPLVQSDNEPANWTRPVESWREGEIIADVHTFQLPADLGATSELVVNVGFFDLDHPEIRLPLTVNEQAIPDGVYTLGPLP